MRQYVVATGSRGRDSQRERGRRPGQRMVNKMTAELRLIERPAHGPCLTNGTPSLATRWEDAYKGSSDNAVIRPRILLEKLAMTFVIHEEHRAGALGMYNTLETLRNRETTAVRYRATAPSGYPDVRVIGNSPCDLLVLGTSLSVSLDSLRLRAILDLE